MPADLIDKLEKECANLNFEGNEDYRDGTREGLSPTGRHKRHATPTVNMAEIWLLWLPGPGEEGYSAENVEN